MRETIRSPGKVLRGAMKPEDWNRIIAVPGLRPWMKRLIEILRDSGDESLPFMKLRAQVVGDRSKFTETRSLRSLNSVLLPHGFCVCPKSWSAGRDFDWREPLYVYVVERTVLEDPRQFLVMVLGADNNVRDAIVAGEDERRQWELAGYRLVGMAPTESAARAVAEQYQAGKTEQWNE